MPSFAACMFLLASIVVCELIETVVATLPAILERGVVCLHQSSRRGGTCYRTLGWIIYLAFGR